MALKPYFERLSENLSFLLSGLDLFQNRPLDDQL